MQVTAHYAKGSSTFSNVENEGYPEGGCQFKIEFYQKYDKLWLEYRGARDKWTFLKSRILREKQVPQIRLQIQIHRLKALHLGYLTMYKHP